MAYEENWMVVWNRVSQYSDAPPGLKVGPYLSGGLWDKGYESSTGYCDSYFAKASKKEQEEMLRNLALELIMAEGLDPQEVHREFMKIKLWQEMYWKLPSGEYRMVHDGVFSPYGA